VAFQAHGLYNFSQISHQPDVRAPFRAEFLFQFLPDFPREGRAGASGAHRQTQRSARDHRRHDERPHLRIARHVAPQLPCPGIGGYAAVELHIARGRKNKVDGVKTSGLIVPADPSHPGPVATLLQPAGQILRHDANHRPKTQQPGNLALSHFAPADHQAHSVLERHKNRIKPVLAVYLRPPLHPDSHRVVSTTHRTGQYPFINLHWISPSFSTAGPLGPRGLKRTPSI